MPSFPKSRELKGLSLSNISRLTRNSTALAAWLTFSLMFPVSAIALVRDAIAANTIPTPFPSVTPESDPSSIMSLLPKGMPPRLLISYMRGSVEAQRRAESLAKLLAAQGIEVADVRESAVLSRTELRFYYAPDQTLADTVGRVAGMAPVRATLPRDGLTPWPATIQLNIAGR